jgi:hypothetical protein
MNKKTLGLVALGVAIGIVFSPQISKIPLVNKIPQV